MCPPASASALALLQRSETGLPPTRILDAADLGVLHRTMRDGLPEGWWRRRVSSRFSAAAAGPVTPGLSARRA